MGRLLRFLALWTYLLFGTAPVFGQTNFAAPAKIEPAPLVPAAQQLSLGERLVYDVFWIGIPVGEGEVWIKEKTQLRGREVFHVVGKVEANAFLSRFYPVKNEVHSWIDAQTLQSVQFQKKLDEGKTRADEKDEFDAARRKGRSVSFRTGETKEFDITIPAQDVLSAFYWVRRQELVPGKALSVVLSCNQKDWKLHVNVLSHSMETLRGHGLVDVILAEPKTQLPGKRARKGKATVYLSNEPRRTPLLVKFITPFGPVEGVLRPAERKNVH